MEKRPGRKTNKNWHEGTDWVVWVVHGILGGVLGTLFGFGILVRIFGARADASLLPLVLGAALMGIGFGSLWGDKLWVGDNYRTFPPESPRATWRGKGLSLASAAVGLLLVIRTVVRFPWLG